VEYKEFEKAFKDVKEFIKTKDKRLKKSKREKALAKQEFLAEIKVKASIWFDNKVNSFKPKI
jgi:hypothetical protein